MKKIALMSIIAVFAFIVLSSFVKLNKQPEYNLGKNQDFKNWVSAMTKLKANLEKTNTKTAFVNYLERKNTIVENKILATKLGYENEAALTLAFNQINSYRNNFIKATPELQTNEGQKIFKEALKEVPACDDAYLLATYNCFTLYVYEREIPLFDLFDMCQHIAMLNYLNCVIAPIE